MRAPVKDKNDQMLRRELLRQRKELTDSLYYASYIQSALLPSRDEWFRLLPDSFIYHNPRDIVSGDFYWIKKYREYLSIVIADCTGHGVPGGFMSVMGISFLNELFSKGCPQTAKSVLNQLREKVMKALHQTGGICEQKDGMDISLCIINYETGEMHFAGANQSIYLIRNNVLMEFKGDLMPIGIGGREEKSFSDHVIELRNNDTIYMFTDGYADQFGGDLNKKFKYIALRQLITDLSKFALKEQGEKISETFDIWKGNFMQVDDVLITGFRYTPIQLDDL
jgi:serine phosphatase RsbU (regulator of sigma subunit)